MSDDVDAPGLLERLLADPGFRAEFRRDPVAAARAAGLDDLAEALEAAGADPLETLELRESRSSLAGVAAAAALEGAGIAAPHDRGGGGGSDRALAALAGRHAAHRQAGFDPAQFGAEGSGGTPSAGTLALLHDKRVTFDAQGIADLRAGRIDPRIVGVLRSIAQKHTITISAMCSDHPKLSAGGSVSNHYYGRGVDIAMIDGQPVGPGHAGARQIAIALGRMEEAFRPTEIGSPWALPGAAYFTDAAHQNHLHVGFDDPIGRSWRPGEEALRAGAAAGAGDEVADSDDSDDADDEVQDADIDDEADGDGNDDEPDEDEPDEDEPDEDEPDEDEPDEDGEPGGDEDDDEEDLAEEDADEEDDDDEDDDEEDLAEEDDDEDSDDDESDGDARLEAVDDDASGGEGDVEGGGGPAAAADLGGDGYPGDDAGTEEIAGWMAGAARRRGVPAELPVMAGLVESGLRNLNFGDADSVGFFQMRLGIWNRGEYAGYPDRPRLQLEWFLDQAVAVKRQRLARGLPVDDPSQYGEWIADIERPAAQYRGRYQLRLDEARELLETAARRSGRGVRRLSADVQRLRLIDPDDAARAKDRNG